MTLGLAFWILMLIWLVGGVYYGWSTATADRFFLGGNVMLFLLFLLVGWSVFGAPLHG
jgi:hypothetical protein